MAAGGISIHGVDVGRGAPAAGMKVELFALDGGRRLIAHGLLGSNGLLDHPVARGEGVAAGGYEAVFYIGDYLKRDATDAAIFLDVVPFRFVVSRVEEHYHLPLKFTPWGFSLFRGF